MDRTDFGENKLEKFESRLRPRLMGRFLDQAIQLRITDRRSVEAPESSKRIAAVDDGVEEW